MPESLSRKRIIITISVLIGASPLFSSAFITAKPTTLLFHLRQYHYKSRAETATTSSYTSVTTKRAMVSAASKKSSWIDIPSDSDFSLDNIPFGVCSFPKSKRGGSSISSLAPSTPRCCTAIGKFAVDLYLLAEAGLLDNLASAGGAIQDGGIVNFHPRIVFSKPTLNEFMSHEKEIWVAVRTRIIELFLSSDGGSNESSGNETTTTQTSVIIPDKRLQTNPSLRNQALHPLQQTLYHLPAQIGDYTDFYSSREHATNVGIMFRGKDNALQPNWLHMPIGYHGRSSSVYPSLSKDNTTEEQDDDGEMMSAIRRPCGQLQLDPTDPKRGSTYGPCKQMDFELEVAFFVGGGSSSSAAASAQNDESSPTTGKPLTIQQAQDRIFGYVLMNDWSARDIQKWEYVPLGPFTAKNFATTISTWVVTTMALEPYRCETSAGVQGGGVGIGTEFSEVADVGGDVNEERIDPTPLEYLRDPNYGSYDVNLSVSLQPESTSKITQICQSNLKHMYWSSVQQLVHHSVTGCTMLAGDLLASGTISGNERQNFGSMLELSWKGTRDIVLENNGNSISGGEGETRTFLKDGDAVIMKGWCEKEGVGRVGFGQCSGRVLPANPYPYNTNSQQLVKSEGRDQHETMQNRYSNFKLYGFWRSSCAWRVRISLAAKGIHYETVFVNLFQEDNQTLTMAATESIGLGGQVPILEFTDNGGSQSTIVRITQSLAIIEFLESAFATQGGQLLPSDPVARAKAKEVAEIINSGTQPLQNLAVAAAIDKSIGAAGGEGSAGMMFGKQAIENGLSSLEALLAPYHSSPGASANGKGSIASGPFAIGTHGPTLADVCLIPQLYNALRFGVDCSPYPTLLMIDEACARHSWFAGAVPELQPDSPDFTT